MADELLNGLKKRAATWASQITRKANTNLGKYKSLIQVKSQVEERGGKISILSTATGSKPVARAYEFGSGIHSRSKKRSKWQQADKTILITPKKKKVLAFYWDKLAGDEPGTWYGGRKLIRKTEEDKALFRYVNHPGVQAANAGRGYMQPAITEVRKQIRKEVPKEMRDAAIGVFRKAFRK